MQKNKNIKKQLINQVVDYEINSIKAELEDEYCKILNDMSARNILFSGITVRNIESKGNEIIKHHLETIVKECNEFPFRIEERDWREIEEKLKVEIEDLETEYFSRLMKLKISSPQSQSLFQKSKNELEYLIKESITKSKIEGFESESNYRLTNRRLAIISLIVSLVSILISVITYFLENKTLLIL